jgi:hypothetical protein
MDVSHNTIDKVEKRGKKTLFKESNPVRPAHSLLTILSYFYCIGEASKRPNL